MRLFGITHAPLEIGHSWRQSLTAMIARNFYYGRANLFYPEIDYNGNLSGIMGSEFPLFNYLIYLFALCFGYEHWFGRLINLIISSAGIYFFYRLVRETINERTAFASGMVLLSSVWFAFSRKIMPDTFSISLVLIALYAAWRYINDGQVIHLLFFSLLATLGVLCKIPAVSLLAALVVLLPAKDISSKRKIGLMAAGVPVISAMYLWYFKWVPHLLESGGFQLYFPKKLSEGLEEILPLLPELAEKFYFSALHSYVALLTLIAGIYFLIRNKDYRVLTALAAISSLFFVFIIKTGSVFPLHNYYIIPFVPVMALLAGIGISYLPAKVYPYALILIALEGIANQQHDFFIKESEKHKLTLEGLMDQYSPKGDLIVVNGGASPQHIYFAHRKGWSPANDSLMVRGFLEDKIEKGAKTLVIDRSVFKGGNLPYALVFSNEHYLIYRLAASGAEILH